MDLRLLHDDGIINQETLDWISPLWEAELVETAVVKEATRSNNLFGGDNDEDDEEDDGSLLMMSKETIPNFLGISNFTFWMDDHSTGHGNRVWHASIATCMYLKEFYSQRLSSSSASWQSLELGAGTALPSLFLGHLMASQNNNRHVGSRPLLHVTDGKQYRNIRQILFSLSKQPQAVLEKSFYRVSSHNWGQDIDDFFQTECPQRLPRCYDLVLVSDCIYNPTFHRDLLKTVAATLKLPGGKDDTGGRAILSFSLHGNTPDQDIWNFVDSIIPETRHEEWRLQASPVPQAHITSTPLASVAGETQQPVEGRHGWEMERIMKELGLWTANIESKRWFSFLYEVTWTKD